MNSVSLYELILAAEAANPVCTDYSWNAVKREFGINEILDDIESQSEVPNSKNKEVAPSIDKQKLIDVLIDRIALSNKGLKNRTNLMQVYTECYKKLFVIKILSASTLDNAALTLSYEILPLAKKHFLLDVVFSVAQIIFNQENRNDNRDKEIHATKVFQEYLEYYSLEQEIKILRNKVFWHYNKTNASDEHVLGFCNEIIEKFSRYEGIIPSLFFHLNLFTIRHIKYSNEKNHLGVYNNASKGLQYFKDLPFDYLSGILIQSYILINYSIQKMQYDAAKKYIDDGLTIVNKSNQHWFRLKENEVLLNLHKGTFEEAYSVFNKAYNSTHFKINNLHSKQRWLLYRAYMHILIEAEQIPNVKKKKAFFLQKFINDQPRFSKDKRAMNIPLLIAQFLFLIIRRKHDDALDRIGALEKYTTRYLRNDETFRSNCFIKMLLEIPKQGFNRIAVERHADKYYKRLIKSEIELIDQPFEIEIIPYEKLWEITLDNLSVKKRTKS